MFNLEIWLQKNGQNLTSEAKQLLKDLNNSKIKPETAAKLLLKNINIKNQFNKPLDQILELLISLAVYSFNPAIQNNCVQLASVLRNLRKSLPKPGKRSLLDDIFLEMKEILEYYWIMRYLYRFDFQKAEAASLWISLNKFSAQLINADVYDMLYYATFLCNSLLEDQKLSKNPDYFELSLSQWAQDTQENPLLFAVSVSATAQHMIYTASNLYTYCKKNQIRMGPGYCWEHWKAALNKARNIENIEARNNAFAAVVAMDMAEQHYKSCQVPEDR